MLLETAELWWIPIVTTCQGHNACGATGQREGVCLLQKKTPCAVESAGCATEASHVVGTTPVAGWGCGHCADL